MEQQDLHWKDERRGEYATDGRVLLVKWLSILFALLVLNSLLITAVQQLTDYTWQAADTILSQYPDCTLLDSAAEEKMQSFLLSSPDGSRFLVTMEQHFLTKNWQFVSELPADQALPVIKADGHDLSVMLENDAITLYSSLKTGFHNMNMMLGFPIYIPMKTLAWIAFLLIPEFGVWLGIKKLRSL